MKIAILFVLVFFAVTGCTQKKQMLFNGKNLEGWTIYVQDTTVAPEKFFYVNDGVIETVGVPVGYLRTVSEFENYRLHAEWRYPETPTNSGIFLHTTGPDLIWVSHYQCQLKDGNAGDFIVHGIGQKATVVDSVYVSSETVKPIAAKMTASSEKKAGEWNSCDIVCKGNTIEITINGVLQNKISNCSCTKGGIGLQAEGSKIQFRNLWVEKLK